MKIQNAPFLTYLKKAGLHIRKNFTLHKKKKTKLKKKKKKKNPSKEK